MHRLLASAGCGLLLDNHVKVTQAWQSRESAEWAQPLRLHHPCQRDQLTCSSALRSKTRSIAGGILNAVLLPVALLLPSLLLCPSPCCSSSRFSSRTVMLSSAVTLNHRASTSPRASAHNSTCHVRCGWLKELEAAAAVAGNTADDGVVGRELSGAAGAAAAGRGPSQLFLRLCPWYSTRMSSSNYAGSRRSRAGVACFSAACMLC